MRRFLLLIMSLVCCYGACLSAGEVSEQEALRKAQLFMEGKTFGLKSLHRAAQSSFAEGAFYVFNADDGNGFVIVSADDRTEAILGYADEGSLDMDCLPANARAWLEGYARQIRSLSGLVSMSAPRRVVGVKVGPLLTCKWDQGLDQEKGLLAGTDFNITLTFTNEGKNAYDDKVDINLTPVNDDESSAGQDVSKSLPLKLAVGATASVSASFTGLMADQRYLLTVSYFTKLDDDGYSADSQEAYYFRR